MAEAYDPLDYDNLARSVVHALLDAPPNELPPDDAFFGSGVYALYYCGTLPFYADFASEDLHTPIYVGKAVPSGGMKGSPSKIPQATTELYRRLGQHAKSVEQTHNLAGVNFAVVFW